MSEFIYGTSESFKKTIEKVNLYAPHPWPVLILGETGVGKELIAKRLHELSTRRSMPLIPVNCSAIPAGLFESEIFGYEKGPFQERHQIPEVWLEWLMEALFSLMN